MLAQTSSAKGSGFLSSVPVIDIDVDTSALSEAIEPEGKGVQVPVTIRYRINVPKIFTGEEEGLLSGLWETIGRWIFFRNPIIPTLKIRLSIVDKPDWVNVVITDKDVEIPVELNKDCVANTSLTITVYKDAPALPYTLTLRAEAPGVGIIQPIETEAQFQIIPGYSPLLDIQTDEPIKEAGPMATVTFPIKITSHANKETIVKLVDYDIPPGWSVQPSQDQVIISPGKTSILSVTVITPAGFGWLPNQVQQIKMKFVAIPSPPPTEYEETSSNTYIRSISVRSGSAPAVGLIGGIVAILVAIVVVILMMLKKKS